MNAELEAIKDAATPDNPDTGEGMDLETARNLADAYVAANPDQFEKYATMTVVDLANAVTLLREAGLVEDQWMAETWLLHRYEPQNIGGVVEPQIRVAGA